MARFVDWLLDKLEEFFEKPLLRAPLRVGVAVGLFVVILLIGVVIGGWLF